MSADFGQRVATDDLVRDLRSFGRRVEAQAISDRPRP